MEPCPVQFLSLRFSLLGIAILWPLMKGFLKTGEKPELGKPGKKTTGSKGEVSRGNGCVVRAIGGGGS